jgi:hypothetical protein
MTGADLQGTVRDATGAAVPASTITVTNLETNLSRTAAADDDGRYVVPALAPGTYTASASAQGFSSQTSAHVVLTLGQTLEIDFVVQVAAPGETVTVSASAPVVSASRLEVASVITQEQIQSLPTNGRNFIAFAALVPGVAPDRTPYKAPRRPADSRSRDSAPARTTSRLTASTTTIR